MVSSNSKIILAVLFAGVAIAQSKECAKVCTLEYNPVCATNGQEYRLFPNPCSFETYECETNTIWRKSRSLDPCSADDTTAISARNLENCEVPCTRDFRPVCGTNGDSFEVFSNECGMKNAHCKDGKTWFQTRMTDCEAPATKRCETPCTRDFRPVCGTNGDSFEIFSNECAMKNAHCKDGKTWFQTRMTDCKAPAAKRCETPCTRELMPVCGTNGERFEMFNNKCIMKNEHCKDGRNWIETRAADCEVEQTLTKNVNCEKPCTRDFTPVCGFDGQHHRIFNNACLMKNQHCKDQQNWFEARMTDCLVRQEQEEEKPKSDCPKMCPLIYGPTCAFDGKSYKFFANKCLMNVASCNQHVNFVQVELSNCGVKPLRPIIPIKPTSETKECPKICPLNYVPICGFDGKTYTMFSNACMMETAACNKHVNFVQVELSICGVEPIVALSETKNCPKICPANFVPTCGFDGKSYKMFGNPCMMEAAACNDHVNFVKVPANNCNEEENLISKTVEVKNCPQICPLNYIPTCGYDNFTGEFKVFSNKCEMDAANCNNNTHFAIKNIRACADM